MKKTYIKPTMKAVAIAPTQLICGSPKIDIYPTVDPDEELDDDMEQW